MSADEAADRTALRERQGKGARYDAPSAPARELAWARRGTAYFARLLNELSNDELYEPSLLPNLSRAHIVAHVGYNARMLASLVAAVRADDNNARQSPSGYGFVDIEAATTQPARALRHLFAHSEVHLNVEWRDLTDEQWTASTTFSGNNSELPISSTPFLRACEVWVHAVDLRNGGSYSDMPQEFADALRVHLGNTGGGGGRCAESGPLCEYLRGRCLRSDPSRTL